MDVATTERVHNTLPILNGRQKRLYIANKARAIGHGGITQVSKASDTSQVTITQGLKEINQKNYKPTYQTRCRKQEGDRKTITTNNLLKEIKELIDPHTPKATPQTH
ncbi:MAG: hypothetical protein LBE76_04230 [Nitrososphaerota archaeon]|nr:hypothetical protein [Nitrososphaerota archaeon]